MTLQDSNGTLIEGVDEAGLLAALGRLERGNIEHIVLSDGAAFVQAAGSGDGYVVEHGGPSGRYVTSARSLPKELAAQIMVGFLRRAPGWDEPGNFVAAEAGAGAAHEGGTPDRSAHAAGRPGETLRDSISHAAQREVASGVGRLVRRAIRGLFR